MASPSDLRATVPRALARLGYRLTGPRRAVLEILEASRAPLTVAEIHRHLSVGRADLVSVYRTVNLLVKTGLVRGTDATRGGVRYELAEAFTGHHHHLLCRGCGRIEDLEGCLLPAAVLTRVDLEVRRDRGFRVTDHELRLFGVCSRCASPSNPVAEPPARRVRRRPGAVLPLLVALSVIGLGLLPACAHADVASGRYGGAWPLASLDSGSPILPRVEGPAPLQPGPESAVPPRPSPAQPSRSGPRRFEVHALPPPS